VIARLVSSLLGLCVLLAAAPAAFAHASLVGSEPTDRAVVAEAPPAIKLRFNEPVAPVSLLLVGPDGRSTALKDVASADQSLTVKLPGPLARGTHLLSWRVISADGHPVGGAMTFSVGEVSAEPPMTPEFRTDRVLQRAIWLCKLVLYGGLMFGVGGAFYAAWIAVRPFPKSGRTFLLAVVQGGLIATVLSIGLQGADLLNLPLSEFRRTQVWLEAFRTYYGTSAGLALAAFALGLASLISEKHQRLLSMFGLLCVGFALSATGHAASAAPQLITRPAVFLHGISVAFWLGALMPLMRSLATSDRRAELLRFSRAIPAGVVVLVASGTALSVVQIGTLDALWTTDYGFVWLGKMAAVALLLALAAWNRFALTQRAAGGDLVSSRRLAASIRLELAIALVILGLVALWRFTPPPRTYLAVANNPVEVHIHTDKAMADVRFEPVRAGARVATLAIWDGNFAPLAAKEVALVLVKPDAGIEPLRTPAVYVADSTWRVERLNLPIAGRWRVRVEILVDDFTRVSIDEEVQFLR
jgi:copper transport protein